MSRPLVLALVLSIAPTAFPPATVSHSNAPPRSDLAHSIDSLITARSADESFSGAVLYAPSNGPAFVRAVGIANRATGSPITAETRMQIASVSKLYTQIAIRQLEQAGKLALTDTVGKFLSAYHNAVVRSRVTVDQLLHHRSGVGSFWNARYMQHLAEIRSVNDYIALFQDDSLLFVPGTSETYSNGGYVLLGAIIERASGLSYHEYLRTHVFGPAGMTMTTPYDSHVALANAAVGYTTQPIGPVAGDQRLAGSGGPRPVGRILRPGDSLPAGGPPPGARLMLIGPDGKQLSPEEARAAMAEHAMGGGASARHPNTAMQPGMSGPAGDHYSTVGDFLKLARALREHRLLDRAHTNAVLGERYASGGDYRAAGGGPGVNAEFSMYRSGDFVVVLSNYDPPAATAIADFIRARIGE